jgi:hypothetical protein
MFLVIQVLNVWQALIGLLPNSSRWDGEMAGAAADIGSATKRTE